MDVSCMTKLEGRLGGKWCEWLGSKCVAAILTPGTNKKVDSTTKHECDAVRWLLKNALKVVSSKG